MKIKYLSLYALFLLGGCAGSKKIKKDAGLYVTSTILGNVYKDSCIIGSEIANRDTPVKRLDELTDYCDKALFYIYACLEIDSTYAVGSVRKNRKFDKELGKAMKRFHIKIKPARYEGVFGTTPNYTREGNP